VSKRGTVAVFAVRLGERAHTTAGERADSH
jgi:hypothetical protein